MLVILFLLSGLVSSNQGFEGSDISDWVEKFVNEKFKKVNLTKECMKLEGDGKAPSALMPLFKDRIFGYPKFNMHTRSITVRPLVTLSKIYGQMQPIRLEAQDYVIAGSATDLLAFLWCFRNYEIIGSSLDVDGHWKKNTGTIKVQLSNLRNPGGINLADDLWEMMFKVSVSRFIRYLKPASIILRLQEELATKKNSGSVEISESSKVMEAIKQIKAWLPQSKKVIDEFMAIFQTNSTLKEKARKFISFIKKEDAAKKELGKKWIEWYNVSVSKRILLTLTMYSKPNNRVRTTYDMGKATVSINDVRNAILLLLNSTIN